MSDRVLHVGPRAYRAILILAAFMCIEIAVVSSVVLVKWGSLPILYREADIAENLGKRVRISGIVIETKPGPSLLLRDCSVWLDFGEDDAPELRRGSSVIAEGTLMDVCLANHGAIAEEEGLEPRWYVQLARCRIIQNMGSRP